MPRGSPQKWVVTTKGPGDVLTTVALNAGTEVRLHAVGDQREPYPVHLHWPFCK